MGRIVNPFEQLAERLGGAPWIGSISGYSPSAEALDGVARWMRILSELARQVDGNEVPHLLASPARLLGYRPGDHAAKEIDEQIARVSDAYAAILVRNAMEWADMSAQGSALRSFRWTSLNRCLLCSSAVVSSGFGMATWRWAIMPFLFMDGPTWQAGDQAARPERVPRISPSSVCLQTGLEEVASRFGGFSRSPA